MTKDEEMQRRESIEQGKDDEVQEFDHSSKPTDISHGNDEEAPSNSDCRKACDDVSLHYKSENSSVRAHKESDVKEISELTNSSNIQLETDYVTSIENEENSPSMACKNETELPENEGTEASKLPDVFVKESAKVSPDVEGNEVVSDWDVGDAQISTSVPTENLNSVMEDLADLTTGEPSETEAENAIVSTSSSENVEACPSSGQESQDESDDTFSSIEDSAIITDVTVGEPPKIRAENTTISNSNVENAKACLPSDQDESDDIFSSAEDSADLTDRTVGAPSKIEAEDTTISNSNVENVKACPPSDQDESDDIFSSAEDSADATVGQPSKMETENTTISNSNVENVMSRPPSGQDESDDTFSSIEDSADGTGVTVGEPPEMRTENTIISNSNMENVTACPSSGQEESDDIFSNVEDSVDGSDVTAGKPSEMETENTTISNSSMENVKACPPSGQDDSDDIFSSVEDSVDGTDGTVGEPSEMETENTTISNANVGNAMSCPPGDEDESDDILSSIEDSADGTDVIVGKPSEMETKNTTISNSNMGNVKPRTSSGQDESDDIFSSVDDSADGTGATVGESPEMRTENNMISNSNMENVKACSPSGQDESGDIFSSIEDSADVTVGEPSEMETENTTISNSNTENEKSRPPGGQDDTDNDLSRTEDPADITIKELQKVVTENMAILNSSVGNEKGSPSSGQYESDDKFPETEDVDNDIVGERTEIQSNADVQNGPTSESENDDDEVANVSENATAMGAEEDNSLNSKEHRELASKTSVDDIKNCAIPVSSQHKDETTRNEDEAGPAEVVAIKPVGSSSNYDVEHNKPAIDIKTSTATVSENDPKAVVTTGSVIKPCGTSASAVPSLKGTAAKYSCVGSALKVSIPSKCIHNAKSPTVMNIGSQKRMEKFSIKNVSKVSKIFKVSNLSYKIKPVLKSAASLDCPIIYVGEPAFVDIEDFTEPTIEVNNGIIRNEESSSLKNQTADIDWAKSIPTAYATSMVMSTHVPPLSHDANQGVNTKQRSGPSIISSTNPSANIPHVQLCSPYSFPPYHSNHSEDRLPEKKTPSVNAVPQRSATFPQGTAFRIVARPAPRPVTSDPQKFVENTLDLAAVKPPPPPSKPPAVAKTFTKPTTITKNLSSNSVVAIANVKSVPNVAVVTSVKTKPTVLQTTVKNKALTATSPMKLAVPGKSSVVKVNIFPARTTSAQPIPKTLPVKSAISKPAVSTVVSTGYKNTSTVYIKTLSTSKSTPTLNAAIHSTKMTAKVDVRDKIRKESDTPITHNKGLRAGVEVAFEDGVRHFISSLSQVTHLDDEPVHSWSELKKGTKVAAPWIDGNVYDATVVGCYIPLSKRMQPVVALESLPTKVCKTEQPKSKTEQPKSKTEQPKIKTKAKPKSAPTPTGKKVGCTRCRKVFISIVDFREHQRLKCNSTGVIVPNAASKVTDQMISAIMKEEKLSAKCDSKTPPTKKQTTASPSPQSHSQSAKRSISKDAKTPPRKKARTSRSNTQSQTTNDNSNEAIFKKGTKFLHRWQLDGGDSKWYQGEVQSVISNKGSFLNWEFEVSYKGEDDDYILKLYEDFPTDIRIIGKL